MYLPCSFLLREQKRSQISYSYRSHRLPVRPMSDVHLPMHTTKFQNFQVPVRSLTQKCMSHNQRFDNPDQLNLHDTSDLQALRSQDPHQYSANA